MSHALNPEAVAAVAGGAMSVPQACEFTGNGRTRLFQLMKAGVLKWYYDGTDRRITRQSLVEYMAALLQQHEAAKKASPKSARVKRIKSATEGV